MNVQNSSLKILKSYMDDNEIIIWGESRWFIKTALKAQVQKNKNKKLTKTNI